MALGAAGGDAVLGSVGRKRLCFALSGEDGRLRPGTIRTYPAQTATGVTAALIGYQRDLALPSLPARSAIAVAGLVRGDAIAITQSRWFVSRSGLHAMLGAPPLILNDFAAEAWGLCTTALSVQEVFGGAAAPTLQAPGTYLVLGITSGLGVAVVHRNAAGAVTVLATEAGHGAFAAVDDELTALAADLSAGRRPVSAEEVISAPGLVAIYALLARRAGTKTPLVTPEEVTRAVASNPVARAACEMLAKAFWAQAGSLAMTFGAWDGVLVIGGLANAIRPSLRLPGAQALFSASTRYRRVLGEVPRALVTLENGELIGVAEALRHG
jgi:glucokinase